MDIPAQCGTTAGRCKDGVKGGKGEMGGTSLVTIVTLEEAVVEGVAEWEGEPIMRDVGATARAVGVITGGGAEVVGIGGGECMIEEELQTRAEEAARCKGDDAFEEGDGEGWACGREAGFPSRGAAGDGVVCGP